MSDKEHAIISEAKEANRFRKELGFSFLIFQDDDKNAIAAAIRTTIEVGLIGRDYDRTAKVGPDGNLSTNFFEDLSDYGRNYAGVMTIWKIDASNTVNGMMPEEKQIKAGPKVSEKKALGIHDMLEKNPELMQYWPFQTLHSHISRILLGYKQASNVKAVRSSHVVLEPNNLMAIIEIPLDRRIVFSKFYHEWLEKLMNNPQEVSLVMQRELSTLLKENAKFQFSNLSFELGEMTEMIISTLYFSQLKYRAGLVLYYKTKEQIDAFAKIGSLDDISKRYLALVKASLSQ